MKHDVIPFLKLVFYDKYFINVQIIIKVNIIHFLFSQNRIGILGSGSDFDPFITKIGVSCVDGHYKFDPNSGLSSYPLYHSVYETFHLVDEIMDPGFKVR